MSESDALSTEKPARRLRRSPADLRAAALAAARRLIMAGPDSGLTMRAVADAIGVTYPNLSHHFGSAAGLHAAIAEDLVRELIEGLRAIGSDMNFAPGDSRRIVDQVFDLFDQGGLGRLIGWLVRCGGWEGAAPSVRAMVGAFLAEQGRKAGHPDGARIAEIALVVCSTAYAETTAGPLFGKVLDLSAEARRAAAARMVSALWEFDDNLCSHK